MVAHDYNTVFRDSSVNVPQGFAYILLHWEVFPWSCIHLVGDNTGSRPLWWSDYEDYHSGSSTRHYVVTFSE